MGILDRFRRKKKEISESTRKMTDLEQLCGDDKETYEALSNTMFLDPKKIDTTLKEVVENAKKAEKENDRIRANTWYRIAGGLAIYKGDAKKVIEYFSAIEKISGTTYSILKNPEKAIAIAQEYYKRHQKE